ncbi:hypothetical protein [Chengkuizengella axinellae]|uniref:DUF1102 domain-containing protein n=1 Tax=Chengkuizengella axinellae TaxID=3064388 RepID=A0ABT9IYJ4_9BACL|nr:hypothetical protein [Chengkuizengella sp. 2205SS18-9]MDP5274385.1 hypothetical protein [Chengkuizengella sp. 2205SS18-9]
MKKALLVIASLLAVSSVMAAMAFSSATVKNDANFSIVDTSGALLAISGNEDHAAVSHDEANDGAEVLSIDFDRGNNGDYGLQPNSEYTWNELFEVTNNSENPVKVSIDFSPSENGQADLADARMELMAKLGENMDWQIVDGASDVFEFGTLGSGESFDVDVKIVQDHGDQDGESDNNIDDAIKEFQIVVKAEVE